VADSGTTETAARAKMFVVSEIDTRSVPTSIDATRHAYRSAGVGGYFIPVVVSRPVPARKVTLKLEGRIVYQAPIQELLMAATVYSAESTIEVVLSPGATYTVLGELSADKREVYLVSGTGERVGTPLKAR
jgi:hypothetical protein